MSHAGDNPELPCKLCKHKAERHRFIPARNLSLETTIYNPDGPWTREHIYCNESVMSYSSGGYTTWSCGCESYEPMDNLEYLENLL